MANDTNSQTALQAFPAEMLGEIFLHTLPVFEDMIPADCDRLSNEDRKDYTMAAELEDHEYLTPLTISSVCQVWRNVATKTARLWSFMFVFAESDSRTRRRGMTAEAVSLWSRRSQGALLTAVCLDSSQALSDSDLDPHPIFALLSKHSERFEKLYISVDFIDTRSR